MAEPETCNRHGLPRIWGKRDNFKSYTYCTACMNERWEREFAKEREERKRFAYLIPYKLWLLKNYAYKSAVWRLQIAKKVHRDFGRPINEVSHRELNEAYGHLKIQRHNKFYSTAKKAYERFLVGQGKIV